MASRARLGSLGLLEQSNLANGVVVTDDLANGAVTGAKIDSNSNIVVATVFATGNVVANASIIAEDVRAVGNIVANGLIIRGINVSDNVLAGNITANTVITDNIVVTAISSQVWVGLYTSNVIEDGNLYFTNVRAIAALQDNISTSNVTEGANLYFTNTRSVAALTAGAGIAIESNGLVSGTGVATTFTGNTDGIAEGVSNFYFTNVRAIAALQDNISTSNVTEGANLYFSNARALAAVQNVISTTEVSEGANLYFSNTRSVRALTAGFGITIESNGVVSANLASATVSTANLQANTGQIGNFTTSNLRVTGDTVIEGNLSILGNATIIQANTLEIADPLIHLAANNEVGDAVDIGVVMHYSPDAGATRQHAGWFRDASDGRFYVFQAYVDDNLDSGNTVTNIDRSNASFQLANVVANTFVGNLQGNVIGLDTNRIPEGSNLYYTNARVAAYIAQSITTSVIAEGSNLYFSNARAIGAVTAGDGIFIAANGLIVATPNINSALGNVTANNLTVSGTITGNVVGQVTDISNHTTSNLAEGSNLYFSNARALSAVRDNISTSNILEGSSLFFSNTRAVGALTAGNFITIEANGLIVGTNQAFSGNTDAVPEGVANLYFSNTRAIGALSAGAGIVLESNGLIVNTGQATVFLGTTDQITEGNSNLYFTNARGVAALTAGNNIVISANGMISAELTANNVVALITPGLGITTESNGVVSANVIDLEFAIESFVMDGANGNVTIAAVVKNENTVFVFLNGLVQSPVLDYIVANVEGYRTVFGNIISLIGTVPANSRLDVRYPRLMA